MATRKVAKKTRKVAKKEEAGDTGEGQGRLARRAIAGLQGDREAGGDAGEIPQGRRFRAKGNPVKPGWSRLLGDLDAWAAKYGVKLSTQEHDHAGTGGTGPVPMAAGGGCPGSFQTKPIYHTTLPGGTVLMEQTSCTLKRKTLLGRCVYSCTDTVFTQ